MVLGQDRLVAHGPITFDRVCSISKETLIKQSLQQPSLEGLQLPQSAYIKKGGKSQTPLGMGPVRSLPERYKSVNSVNSPNCSGIVPLRELSRRLNWFKEFNSPICVGIFPLRALF